MYTLTSDQQEACNKFGNFLLDDSKKEFYLFGAAGSGKTYCISHMLNQGLKEYENSCKVLGIKPTVYTSVYLTAPTNKATQVLSDLYDLLNLPHMDVEVSTAYSLYNLVVKENYHDGTTSIKQSRPTYLSNSIIIVDECSMLPKDVIEVIRHNTGRDCKIIFIGDNYQLAPVNEKPFWTSTPDDVTAVLSTPVRNQGQQALVDLCTQFRDTVDTLTFKPISLVPNVIEWVEDEGAKDWLLSADFSKSRVLCYTNNKVLKYLDWIQDSKNQTTEIKTGHPYVCNNSYVLSTDSKITRFCFPDELLEIVSLGKSWSYQTKTPNIFTPVRDAVVRSLATGKVFDATISTDPLDLKLKIDITAKRSAWADHFALKQRVLDLRLPYASTIHKSQGSTFDEVFIDLTSFRSCEDIEVAARLMYVAISRARSKVVFYGSFPKKFGELL